MDKSTNMNNQLHEECTDDTNSDLEKYFNCVKETDDDIVLEFNDINIGKNSDKHENSSEDEYDTNLKDCDNDDNTFGEFNDEYIDECLDECLNDIFVKEVRNEQITIENICGKLEEWLNIFKQICELKSLNPVIILEYIILKSKHRDLCNIGKKINKYELDIANDVYNDMIRKSSSDNCKGYDKNSVCIYFVVQDLEKEINKIIKEKLQINKDKYEKNRESYIFFAENNSIIINTTPYLQIIRNEIDNVIATYIAAQNIYTI